MSLVDQQHLFAVNLAKLFIHIDESGVKFSIGEVFRTPEQAVLYAKEGKGIVDSLHCKRLAADLNLFSATGEYLADSKDYETMGLYWESLDPLNRWGGRFKRADGNHIEMQEVTK
jgi:hypothetical protein